MPKIIAAVLALTLTALTMTACSRGGASAQTTESQTTLEQTDAQTTENAVSDETDTTDEIPPAQPQSEAAPKLTTTDAPPADTTGEAKMRERMTTVQNADGSTGYAFETTSICLHSYTGEKSFPRGTAIDSAAALDAFFADNDTDYGFSRQRAVNPDVGQDYDKTAARYDDAWFASHRLLIAEIESSSGSFRHKITAVTRAPGGDAVVEYTRTEPEVYTCDMAYWLIFIELDTTDFCGTDAVTVRRAQR